MVDAMHLALRFLHVSAAMLWVGYLGLMAWVVIPAARKGGSHGPNVGPIVDRLRPFTLLGPLVFLLGFGLVTATGRPMADLIQPGWGHAVLGGIAISLAMMGLEHGLVVPRLRKAHQAAGEDRLGHLSTAGTAAGAAAVLGLMAAFLMVLALLGGF